MPGSSQGFQGTGFLVHENLIITNRHVLQVTADWQSDGSWKLKSGAAIDFGHEFNARESLNRRLLRRVVFAGPDPIRNFIDHKKLDLALFELDLVYLPQRVGEHARSEQEYFGSRDGLDLSAQSLNAVAINSSE